MEDPLQKPDLPPRLHCHYCGEDFFVIHGELVKPGGVICPNPKCRCLTKLKVTYPLGVAVAPGRSRLVS